MLRMLRRHRLVRDCVEVASHATLYLAAMLVMILLLGRMAHLLTSWI
jgi:hypothetical protein